MGQIAFVFSGQGDQRPGMGRQLAQSSQRAQAVFAQCDALRPGTSAQCFFGTEQELRETANTQPCLFAVELAAAAALRERGIVPSAVAGFSLGEVAAAAYSGLVSLEDGFSLVCRRGTLMQVCAEQQPTTMAAVLKLTEEQVKEIAGACGVYPVNFNCPGQISVSGEVGRMEAFCREVRNAGGRSVPLKVNGAFHSPYMQEAAEAFRRELEQVPLHRPRMPLYANATGTPYGFDDEAPAALLSRQIASPVLWERLIRNMAAAGIEEFVEIGPGRTLTNLIRKILPEAVAYTAQEGGCPIC